MKDKQSTELITNFEKIDLSKLQVFDDSEYEDEGSEEELDTDSVSLSSKFSNYLNSSHPYPSVRGASSASESGSDVEFREDQIFIGLMNPSKQEKMFFKLVDFL